MAQCARAAEELQCYDHVLSLFPRHAIALKFRCSRLSQRTLDACLADAKLLKRIRPHQAAVYEYLTALMADVEGLPQALIILQEGFIFLDYLKNT